ncbi:hypothetical protein TNCT1_12930 [Streptomyces sp. 1-11]|nr:hypothetical protein TNCT1_12930 [Streptomyces sp. 1-11]
MPSVKESPRATRLVCAGGMESVCMASEMVSRLHTRRSVDRHGTAPARSGRTGAGAVRTGGVAGRPVRPTRLGRPGVAGAA